MATSTFRNKNKVRPIKTGTAKRERVKSQRKRLVALGYTVEEASKMQTDQIHAALRCPLKTKAKLAARAEKAQA